MNHWGRIREKAREIHNQLAATAGNDHSPAAILSAADTASKHQRIAVPANDPLLYGSEATLHSGFIWYNAELPAWKVIFNQAHEFAHFWLHGGSTHACLDCEFDSEASEDESPVGVERVEGYGPHQRRELEANVFARELLLPTDLLREWFLDENLNASQIALRTGLPDAVVFHQLAMALFAPDLSTAEKEDKPEPPLDESQREAAHAENGPLLVEAGPGTGKTRTLVGRIVWLLEEKKCPPESILALTFSNKAAEEMRSRVARVTPVKAVSIWMGTFHAFGLEILRRFGDRIGLPKTPTVIDPVDALYMLEESLDALDLEHYRDLVEPSKYLPAILAAISRAKDELAGPEEYQRASDALRSAATSPDEVETAEKAAEVARVFAFYEKRLTEEGALDYGDLIRRSALLLREHADIRDTLRTEYSQVVVDEYQDVNTASRLLLKELAGDGSGLWVVGDQLQAIYRFRGAAPLNMTMLTGDFPGARVVPLKKNYRSQEHVVRAFATFGRKIKAGQGKFLSWDAHREEATGSILYEVADDERSEAEGIADRIVELHKAGTSYKDQAILCRTHSGLAKLCGVLESRGIPLFYLGDLFERDEIRDLLCVLSLAAERKGSGLLRVSQFPEYGVAPREVLTLLKAAREEDLYFPKALEIAEVSEELSPSARASFKRVSEHLEGISYGTSAWTTLAEYLFTRSAYARNLCTKSGVLGAQQRIAVYQLLQFAHRMLGHLKHAGEDPKRAFLDYIRRLELYGQERQLRQPPAWAAGIDAVRMLTVHASKGLEFSCVYLPQLGKGRTPLKPQPSSCTVPPSLVPEKARDWHLEEEECLFFVALSRTRDHLWLSRATRYGKQNSNPSDFLGHLEECLPREVERESTLPTVATSSPLAQPETPRSSGSQTASNRELETYMRCPKQYLFDSVFELGGKRTNTAYVRFHACVYRTLNWMGAEEAKGTEVTHEGAFEVLDIAWNEGGPKGHVYEKFYRREAERFLKDAIGRLRSSPGKALEGEWEIRLKNGTVTVKPDRLTVSQQGKAEAVIVQRWRTGKPPKKAPDDEVFALYIQGGRLAFPKATVGAEVLYLSTGETRDATPKESSITKSLAKYDEAFAGISQGRFEPVPNDWYCPRCPHYFACPAPGFASLPG